MIRRVLLCALVAGLLGVPALADKNPLEGWWVGGYTLGDTFNFVRINISRDKAKPVAIRVDMPLQGINGEMAHQSQVRPDGFEFSVRVKTTDMTFSGRLSNGEIEGRTTLATKQGSFQLFRLYQVDLWSYDNYIGTYVTGSGPPVLFFRMGNRLFCLHRDRVVPLYPISATTFFTETGDTISFQRDKEDVVTGLIQTSRQGGTLTAEKRALYEEEDVYIPNGDVNLSGTLFLPPGRKRVPAVVLVHGSGPQDRDPYRMFADHFVRQGLAVLIYDKRGVGASAGNRLTASFDDLASDALAAIRILKTHRRIDPRRIGLWGISQGGWVVARAAARSNDVAFAVLVSCPGVTPAQQETFRIEDEMKANLVPADLQAEVRQAWQAMFAFVKHRDSAAEVDARVRRLKQYAGIREWLPPLTTAIPAGAWYTHFDVDYDPVTDFRRWRCPALVIYGALDRIVPVEESAQRIEDAFRKGGERYYTFKIFPGANHNILEAVTGGRDEWLMLRNFAPGYFNLMSDWMAGVTRDLARKEK